jgi:aryl-alcohol dehydrogenase-like predicted oxidoreductase
MIIAVSARNVQLGLGLIGIGKPWGVVPKAVPAEREAIELLEFAFELGVRYFDTAPSYGDGLSEERLGRFVKSLPSGQRGDVRVATKFGEHWSSTSGEPYADHGWDALCRSLERSLARLGRIDVLQLHKTTPQALASDGVARAWDFAGSLGIRETGASVSDLDSARIAIADSRYTMLQMPFNCRTGDQAAPPLAPALMEAAARGMWIAVNRPFAMGAIAADKAGAFRFILQRDFTGVILSGTTSRRHLRENWDAFHSVA